MTISPQTYVRTLDNATLDLVTHRLADAGIMGDALVAALDSRLCDLADVINITDL